MSRRGNERDAGESIHCFTLSPLHDDQNRKETPLTEPDLQPWAKQIAKELRRGETDPLMIPRFAVVNSTLPQD